MYCQNCESEVVEDKGECVKCEKWLSEEDKEEKTHYRDLEIKSKSLVGV